MTSSTFPSRRSAVAGMGPVVATSQPLAAQAGLQAMLRGGNAFDAAVAAAAMLAVVEPTGCGMGGDAFAIAYTADTRRIEALNGSGRSPASLTAQEIRARGHDAVPARGPLPITVPGAVDAWSELLRRHGTTTLRDALGPAIDVAERGYPVTERIAAAWQASESLLAADPSAREHLLPAGRAPRVGEVVRLPALARSLRLVADGGRDAFYDGPLAEAIASAVQERGGFLHREDLAAHRSTWDEPIAVRFRTWDVWECPPNGQGLAALLALGIADGLELERLAWGSPDHLHLLIEAMRLGLADAAAHVADPEAYRAPVDELLSPEYLSRRRATIRRDRALAAVGPGLPTSAGTVYLAVVDAKGNGCSFIQSNYMGFGSGIVAGDTGIPLQNRGAGFDLAPGRPNSYAPSKRPFHTIIPALATREDGSLAAVFGVMGGHMQPQGHLQVVANLAVCGMDPQTALDAPRFQLLPDGRLALEPWFGPDVRAELAARGHDLVPVAQNPPPGSFGGGQVILLEADGVRTAGSDPRKDGQAVAAW